MHAQTVRMSSTVQRSTCVAALIQVPDRRPLTDGLSVSRYMVGIETYEPKLFCVSNFSKFKLCAITPASHGRSWDLLARLMTQQSSMLSTTTLIRYCGNLLSLNRSSTPGHFTCRLRTFLRLVILLVMMMAGQNGYSTCTNSLRTPSV